MLPDPPNGVLVKEKLDRVLISLPRTPLSQTPVAFLLKLCGMASGGFGVVLFCIVLAERVSGVDRLPVVVGLLVFILLMVVTIGAAVAGFWLVQGALDRLGPWLVQPNQQWPERLGRLQLTPHEIRLDPGTVTERVFPLGDVERVGLEVGDWSIEGVQVKLRLTVRNIGELALYPVPSELAATHQWLVAVLEQHLAAHRASFGTERDIPASLKTLYTER